ncbi:MAG: HesA/MoeB/ThiF family protein [Thermodesulforhabdaceae bacterium]|jgi:molybdopterin/thiamine biosynthesis adenylyltransferase
MIEIPDQEVLSLSRSLKIPVGEAAARMIEKGMIPERYAKNLGILSADDQARICRTRILVCGCGGLGGHIIQLAARLGFGFIRIADPDRFDPSNLNRQPFCIEDTLFRSKVFSTKEMVSRINCLVEVEALEEPVSPSHFNDVDLVIDGLDNPADRIRAEKEARQRGIPFVHGAVRGWWGQVTTVMPQDPPRLASIYTGFSQETEKREEELGTLVPVVSIIASVQIHEAIRLATNRNPLYAGKLFYWDGETETAMAMPI